MREDCVKRDVKKAEKGDKWREKAADRETWKGITAGAVERELASPLYKGSNKEEHIICVTQNQAGWPQTPVLIDTFP